VNKPLLGGYCFDIDRDFYEKRNEEHDNFERQLLAQLNQSDDSEDQPFVATRINAIRVFEIVWHILFDEEFHPNKDADTGLPCRPARVHACVQSRLQVHRAFGRAPGQEQRSRAPRAVVRDDKRL
jgi:hypothetical protein